LFHIFLISCTVVLLLVAEIAGRFVFDPDTYICHIVWVYRPSITPTAMADTFEVLLEKKARGRSAFVLSRPWAVRTFKLTKQKLEYFDVDKLKDSVDVRDSICKLIAPEDADNKPFPFELDVGKEKLLLNAPNEQIRKKCMEIFKIAAQDPNWSANIRASVNRVSIQTTASQLQQKAELAAEEKRLNEVRAQQQAIVAASLLQGEAALQKDVQSAALADKKLKEEQVCCHLQIILLRFCLLVVQSIATPSHGIVQENGCQSSFPSCKTNGTNCSCFGCRRNDGPRCLAI
jgi:hypothetical protein